MTIESIVLEIGINPSSASKTILRDQTGVPRLSHKVLFLICYTNCLIFHLRVVLDYAIHKKFAYNMKD